eukprot:TRINITY_DN18941_c0_g2_i1.p1 TRINITY_DN18941_c0_g2~~TRINITY_DN18941_c0_g2_i1.p1  ORF type:complete len:159 (+),score=12.76 TRINITY_DN18941_c0_g2_i1:188-664(+)
MYARVQPFAQSVHDLQHTNIIEYNKHTQLHNNDHLSSSSKEFSSRTSGHRTDMAQYEISTRISTFPNSPTPTLVSSTDTTHGALQMSLGDHGSVATYLNNSPQGQHAPVPSISVEDLNVSVQTRIPLHFQGLPPSNYSISNIRDIFSWMQCMIFVSSL